MRIGKEIIITLAIVCFTLNTANAANKKCRALVLEGGGDMGSYQVGVLKAFVDNLPKEEVEWDVITGVSVGSINAASISLHEIGQEKVAIDWMLSLWKQFGKRDIYRNWMLGPLQGLFFKPGLWDNTAEADYLQEKFKEFPDRELKRRININTVDFDTGAIYKYREDVDFDVLPKAVRASTSMPFAFPHTYLDGHAFVDGGSVWNIDLSGAIKRCKEIVDNDKDIIVDVVMCNGANNVTDKEHKKYNAMQNYGRYQQIRAFYSIMSDYCEIKRGYPNVNFRYILSPQEDLPSGFLPLGFDHDSMVEMINIGIKEGEQAIHDQQNILEDMLKTPLGQTLCPSVD